MKYLKELIVMVIIYFSYLRYLPLIGVSTDEAEYKNVRKLVFLSNGISNEVV